MPVEPQIYEFPLNGGLDTKSDEKVVALPSFLDIKNMVFTKHGSLIKRNGYTALSMEDLSDTALSNLKGLAVRDDELVAYSKTKCYGYSVNQDKWVDQGDFALFKAHEEAISDRSPAQTNVVYASDGTIRVYAWEEAGGGYYSVYSGDGKTQLTGATLVSATATKFQAAETESGVLVSYIDTALVDINFLVFPSNTATPTTKVLNLTDLNTDYIYDFNYNKQAEIGLLGYKDTGDDLRLFTVDKTGTYGYEDTGLPATTLNVAGFIDIATAESYPITSGGAYDTDGDLFHIAWGITGGTYSAHVDFTSSTLTLDSVLVVSATTLYDYCTAVTYQHDDGTMKWNVLYTDGTDTFKRRRQAVGFEEAAQTFAQDVVLAGKPIRTDAYDTFGDPNDKWVVPLAYQSNLQDTLFIYNSSGNPVAAFARGFHTLNTTKPYPNAHRDSSDILSFVAAAKQRVDVAEDQTDAYTQEGIMHYTLEQSGFGVDTAEDKGSTYLGGSLVWQYDGNGICEAGFLIYPELDRSTFDDFDNTLVWTDEPVGQPFSVDTNSGTSTTYVYYVVYEWFDNQGVRHQSAAVPITVLNAPDPSSNGIKFTIPDLNVTWKSDVRAAVYRTHSDSTAIAYRIPHNGGSLYPGLDLSSGPFSFTDVTPDSTVKAGEVLYLSSGELGNVAPIGSTSLLSHNDRLFLAKDNSVYFSKQGGGFNEGLTFEVPDVSGDITGLAEIDDKLVIFKRDRIYMVSGEGPNALGLGAYSEPRLVSTDTGCKDSRTIVRMPQGIMFQSDKGIYLLNRGEAVAYIGAAVEAYNDNTFVAASLIPDKQQVRFLASSGRTLVYDYLFGTWTTFTEHAGLGAAIIDDTYYYLRSTGDSVFKENSGYLDDASAIVAELELPWIRPDGLQQRWHIRRGALLGNFTSDHDLKVSVAFNYREYDAYSKTWDPDSALNTGTLGGNATLGGGAALGINDATKPDRVYQVGHIFRDQRVMAVKLTITEVPPASDVGASFELTGLAIEAAGYSDTFKLPGSKTI